jgi:hypothetical protein
MTTCSPRIVAGAMAHMYPTFKSRRCVVSLAECQPYYQPKNETQGAARGQRERDERVYFVYLVAAFALIQLVGVVHVSLPPQHSLLLVAVGAMPWLWTKSWCKRAPASPPQSPNNNKASAIAEEDPTMAEAES